MEDVKASDVYNAIREMEKRDYSENEIINGIERLLKKMPFVII